MKTYELISPCDYILVDADDLEVAAVAVVLIGGGKMSLVSRDDDKDFVPLFLFGGRDVWFREKFARDADDSIDAVLEDRAEKLAACFESFRLGRGQERTSTNDICGAAHQTARNVRKWIEKREIKA